MGFVGGGGNIDIVTALPLLNFFTALYLNIHSFMASIHLIFRLACNFGFQMCRLTRAHYVLSCGLQNTRQ